MKSYQFKEGLLELRNSECVLRNDNGSMAQVLRYEEFMPFLKYYEERHTVKNILCFLGAALFWGTDLFLLVLILQKQLYWGMSVLLPGIVLGYLFYKRIKKNYRCYILTRYEDNATVLLTPLKRKTEEQEFILEFSQKLQKHSGIFSHLKKNEDPHSPKWFFELDKLREQGIITEEEYSAEKQKHLPGNQKDSITKLPS